MTQLNDAVQASWAAYWENGLDPSSPHPETLGYTDITWLPGKRGFCGIKNGVFTVAVAGTRSVMDVITDVRGIMVQAMKLFGNMVTVSGRPMRIHSGFWADAREIADAVLSAYCAAFAKNPHITVLFTGHSLGAAIVSVMSRFWTLSEFQLITFGQPRTGDWRFVFAPNRATVSTRCRHARDAVPTLPCGLGYEHHGVLLHLDDRGKVRWWVRLFRYVTRDLPLWEDHPVRKYAAVVASWEAP